MSIIKILGLFIKNVIRNITDGDFRLTESGILTRQNNITHHGQFTASAKLKMKKKVSQNYSI